MYSNITMKPKDLKVIIQLLFIINEKLYIYVFIFTFLLMKKENVLKYNNET